MSDIDFDATDSMSCFELKSNGFPVSDWRQFSRSKTSFSFSCFSSASKIFFLSEKSISGVEISLIMSSMSCSRMYPVFDFFAVIEKGLASFFNFSCWSRPSYAGS